jgi:hypothetical protein
MKEMKIKIISLYQWNQRDISAFNKNIFNDYEQGSLPADFIISEKSLNITKYASERLDNKVKAV